MSKTSTARWQASQLFTVYGARILVQTNRASLMPALLGRLPLGARLIEGPGEQAEFTYSITAEGQSSFSAVLRHLGRRVAVAASEEQLLAAFEQQMVNRMANSAPERVFIHAGVVGWHGRAILIPARSTHGKTTLTMTFLGAGATYYSDEFALLDRDGLVHPYARPLQVRMVKGSLAQTQVPAEELAKSGIGEKPIRPAMLLACRYSDGARWRPSEMTAGAAALELTRHSTSAYRYPQAAFQATSQAAMGIKAFRGRRGEAREVVDWALQLLEAGD